jgi:hypothetical protein
MRSALSSRSISQLGDLRMCDGIIDGLGKLLNLDFRGLR